MGTTAYGLTQCLDLYIRCAWASFLATLSNPWRLRHSLHRFPILSLHEYLGLVSFLLVLLLTSLLLSHEVLLHSCGTLAHIEMVQFVSFLFAIHLGLECCIFLFFLLNLSFLLSLLNLYKQ